MKLHIDISELVIDPTAPLPIRVADKLLRHHIWVMNPFRIESGLPLTASLNSGYRPYAWEKAHGRNGLGQHTFGESDDPENPIDEDCLGAVDWRCSDLDLLEKYLIEKSPYTRIARYSGFIHADYKAKDGKRYYFTSGADSKWTFIKNV